MAARTRWGAGALAAAVALGLAACGSGASSTTLPGPFSITTGPGAGTTSTTTTTSTSASTSKSSPSASRRRPAGRRAPSSHRAAAPATHGRSSGRSSRPAPAASPSRAVPAGLVASTGYASYELCQGTCSGAVPASLRRPLRIPAADGGPCPISLRADGPVSPSPGSPLGVSAFVGSDWMGAQVTWAATAGYAGPVLIRGRQIGGAGGAMGFGEGHTPYDELQLLNAGAHAPRVPGGGRAWLTYTRVQGPGCYAYQVDGTSFTEVFVFRAA